MDTTEENVRMCEKAEEVQIIGKAKSTELDDWYYEKATQLFSIGTFADESDIWLPRQDQLQEMIDTEIISRYIKLTTIGMSLYYNRFKALDLWIDKLSRERNYYADRLLTFSGEQLWLAFAMYEKYSKIWNGDNWAKAKN